MRRTCRRAGPWWRRRIAEVLGAGAIALVAGATVAACGVPTDAKPHPLPASAIPFDLLRRAWPATSSTSTTTPVGVPVRIFFLDAAGYLGPVNRNVAAHPSGGELDAVMGALILGPTSVEADDGYRGRHPPRRPGCCTRPRPAAWPRST